MVKTSSVSSKRKASLSSVKSTSKRATVSGAKATAKAGKSKTAPTSAVASQKSPASSQPKAVQTDLAENTLNKKQLIEDVMAKTDMKRGQVRTVVEATLAVMRDALSDGKSVAAAPLGKVKVTRKKETPNGSLVVCRIKLKDAASDNKQQATIDSAK